MNTADIDRCLGERIAQLEPAPLEALFTAQGAFVHVEEFLPEGLTSRLVEVVGAVRGAINRNYLPGHKQGGSVSRHAIDAAAPGIAALYRSAILREWLERVCGERLQPSPADDPHAYALYFYSRAGDHIGWHYDTSYYRGRRYTLLFGLIDDSSCRLEYELHTRDEGAEVERGSLQLAPGGLVFFEGDRLRHRITPARDGELRVSLTFEYVTDPRMHPGWRLISNMKDAFAYFGLRQVFARRHRGPERQPARSAKRVSRWLLSAGVLLFIGLLVSQGLPAIMATLAAAGWGLIAVALFHLLPLWLDASAIRVLFLRRSTATALRVALLARWAGESVNSLMPAGQLGGPVLMTRQLFQRGMPLEEAAAAVTVSTTLQTVAQIAFALMGVVLLGAATGHVSSHAMRNTSLIASAVLAAQIAGFYLLQRRGLFGRVSRFAAGFSGTRDWSALVSRAEDIDAVVAATYGRGGPVIMSFLLSLVGWLVGTGEVFWLLQLLGHPVDWVVALVLESLGQAIRGAAFAIPGALGIQEGGYLLLAPIAGLSPDTALALSLAKRAREMMLGVPGLLYLHRFERSLAANH